MQISKSVSLHSCSAPLTPRPPSSSASPDRSLDSLCRSFAALSLEDRTRRLREPPALITKGLRLRLPPRQPDLRTILYFDDPGLPQGRRVESPDVRAASHSPRSPGSSGAVRDDWPSSPPRIIRMRRYDDSPLMSDASPKAESKTSSSTSHSDLEWLASAHTSVHKANLPRPPRTPSPG